MPPSNETLTPARDVGSHTARRGRDLSPRVALTGLAIVLVVALALRLYGVNWDEGYSWTPHPDERAILSKVHELSPPPLSDLSVLFDAEASPWNPRWFAYGSFPLYMLKGVELVSDFVPGLDVQDMRVPGRVLSALADVGTVALVYFLGASIWSRRVGTSGRRPGRRWLCSTSSSAISSRWIRSSRCSRQPRSSSWSESRGEGRTMDSALAGLFLGLALATKISVAPMLAAYFVAHFMYAFGLAPSDDARHCDAGGQGFWTQSRAPLSAVWRSSRSSL